VDIDKTRDDEIPVGVNDALRRHFAEFSDSDDRVAANRHISPEIGIPGAVQDTAVPNQDVDFLCVDHPHAKYNQSQTCEQTITFPSHHLHSCVLRMYYEVPSTLSSAEALV
jgi:hypothetical protein